MLRRGKALRSARMQTSGWRSLPMKKMSFSLIAAAAVLVAPIPAFAFQDSAAATVQPRKNQMIVDANGRVLGKVYEVNGERGYVSFMANMKVYRVPLSSLTTEGSKLKTTLTRAEVGL
jgi:hypothetical protein